MKPWQVSRPITNGMFLAPARRAAKKARQKRKRESESTAADTEAGKSGRCMPPPMAPGIIKMKEKARLETRAVATELLYDIFWDQERLDGIARRMLVAGIGNPDGNGHIDLTSMLKRVADVVLNAPLRFCMDSYGINVFRDTSTHIRYEWLTAEQRALIFYVFRHRRHVFADERDIGDGVFWAGSTYLSPSVMETSVNREAFMKSIVGQVLVLSGWEMHTPVCRAISAFSAVNPQCAFASRLYCALIHPEFSLEELEMLPARRMPEFDFVENLNRFKNRRVAKGSLVFEPLVAATPRKSSLRHPATPHGYKKKQAVVLDSFLDPESQKPKGKGKCPGWHVPFQLII